MKSWLSINFENSQPLRMWNACTSFIPLIHQRNGKTSCQGISNVWFKILLTGVGFRWKKIEFRPFYYFNYNDLVSIWDCDQVTFLWHPYAELVDANYGILRSESSCLKCNELFPPNLNDFHSQMVYEGVVMRRRWLESHIFVSMIWWAQIQHVDRGYD